MNVQSVYLLLPFTLCNLSHSAFGEKSHERYGMWKKQKNKFKACKWNCRPFSLPSSCHRHSILPFSRFREPISGSLTLFSIFSWKKICVRKKIAIFATCSERSMTYLLNRLRNHHSKKKEQNHTPDRATSQGVGFLILVCRFVVNL